MSRTAAINAKCKDCIYDPLAGGTWREQTEACRSGPDSKNPCALWPYRPITINTVTTNRKTRIVEDATGIDIDALVNGLEDEDDVPEAVV